MGLRPLDYASEQIRKNRSRRIQFGHADKIFAVTIDVDGEGYFAPLSSQNNQVKVTHDRRVNVNDVAFSSKYNTATAFAVNYERAATDNIVKTTDRLSHSLGRSRAPPLKIGSLTIDPLLDEYESNRLSKPIHIFKHQKLNLFIEERRR